MSFKSSFKSAIEKFTQMFVNKEEQMQKHEEYLHTATNEAAELRIVVNKKATPCICVYITPGQDINHVQELYGKVGIKLHEHTLKRGNRNQNILYIKSSDFEKLGAKQKLYFKRTTTNHNIYKQNLTYSIGRDKIK